MNLPLNKRNRKMKKPKHKNNRKFKEERLPLVMPHVWYCINRYISQIIGNHFTGQIYGTMGWYINTPFIPDILGADTSNAIGCAELTNIYGNYIVHDAFVSLDVCNEEDFEIVIVGAPYATNILSSIGSGSEALQIGELPWGKSFTLGRSSGMNRRTVSWKISMQKLIGNTQLYNGEQNFIGANTAQPVNKIYMLFGIISLSGNTLDNGITFRYKTDFKIKWSSRKFEDVVFTGEKHNQGKPRLIDEPKNEKESIDEEINRLSLKLKDLVEIKKKL